MKSIVGLFDFAKNKTSKSKAVSDDSISSCQMQSGTQPDVQSNSADHTKDDKFEFWELSDLEVEFVTGGNNPTVEITSCRMCGKLDNVVIVEDRGDSLYVECTACNYWWTCM